MAWQYIASGNWSTGGKPYWINEAGETSMTDPAGGYQPNSPYFKEWYTPGSSRTAGFRGPAASIAETPFDKSKETIEIDPATGRQFVSTSGPFQITDSGGLGLDGILGAAKDAVGEFGQGAIFPVGAALGVGALTGAGILPYGEVAGMTGTTAGAAGGEMDWLTQLLKESGEYGVDPLALESGFNPMGSGLDVGGFGVKDILSNGGSLVKSILSGGSGLLEGLGGKGLGALLGGAAGLLGGSKQGGTTTTVQDIPEWLKPYAMTGLGGLADAYASNPTGVSPVTNAGAGYLTDTIEGDYLNSNPYLDAMYDKAAGKVSGSIAGQFSKYNRLGSGAHQGVLGETLGNLATDIYGGNYNQERARQQQAAMGSANFGDSILGQRFKPAQNLLGGVNSVKGSTTSTPYFENKLAEILSGAFGGSRIFG